MQRREAQHLLQVERAHEPHREQRRAEQQHDVVGDPQRLGQLLEGDQRCRGQTRLDHAEHREQGDAADDRAERGERVPALQARFHDPVHEHHLADRQRQRAGEVEACARPRSAALAHDRVGHQRGRNRDRRVDQQHPAPAELLGDDPAEQHAGGAAEPVHRRPQADRAVELRARRERRGDDRQRARRHQGAAEALHRARDDQHLPALCGAAGQRGEPEQEQRQDEHAALPEVVGGATAEHQEARERDRVGVDDPLQFGRGEAEAQLDRGQRDVDDAQVEDHHELGHAADGQEPRRTGARACSRSSAAGVCVSPGLAAASALMTSLPDCDRRCKRLVG